MAEHDNERDRQRRQAVHDDSSAGHVPGRGTRSGQMSAPERPIVSALIQREARDANGVGPDADVAVQRASQLSGAALPDALRTRFEGSLGTDLSSVRVHTSETSASAASAVGAKAYTLGNDIHFGAGHYDPSSVGGQHLLAHEVAHTVQQRGGSAFRQNKLEVSSPGDVFEVEADRAADAMVAGQSASVGVSAGLVARDKDHDPETCVDPKAAALTGERQSAMSAVGDAEAAFVAAMQRMEEWFIGDVDAFITKTSTPPAGSYNPSFVQGAVGLGAKTALSAAGGAANAALSKMGIRGRIAGFAAKLIADALGSSLQDKIAGGHPPTPAESASAMAAEIRKNQDAALHTAFASGMTQFTEMHTSAEKARHTLLDLKTTDGDVDAIRDWATSETAFANSLQYTSGALLNDMLSRWVGDRTENVDTPKGEGASRWKEVCMDLFGTPNVPPMDVWRYKLRSQWAAMGLDGDEAFRIPAIGGIRGSGQWMFQAAKVPARFAARFGNGTNTPRFKYLSGGGAFKLVCAFQTDMQTSVHLTGVDNMNYAELMGTSYTLDLLSKVDADPGESDGGLPPTDGS
ncbi:MAG TPA: DUF4157 domain-containing protein, partial [Kofleriaceae bacterium]|nr:DUF4157 domain-containing protein [Kofleriaceae bacterium]